MLWLNGLFRDLDYAFRMIRNARLVSIAVTVTLAVGIGINTGIFTIIDGMLLRIRQRLRAFMRSIGREEIRVGLQVHSHRRRIVPFSGALNRSRNSRRGVRMGC